MTTDARLPLLPGVPDGPLGVALPLLGAAAMLVALQAARRRGWPAAFRRAMLCFVLLCLVAAATAALPGDLAAALRPHLHVAFLVLGWFGVLEVGVGVIVDLLLGRLLKRPPPPRILRDLTSLLLLLAVFFLALRGTFGVNLTSLLATSAMISVILGLALQDTLGSFFAGLALQMEAPLAIGDWVQIGDHQGKVAQVSWRTVRLVNLETDEVTLPNSLVTRSTLVNFSRPTTAHLCFAEVPVDRSHPPSEVIAALAEAAREHPEVLADPPPHALVWEFAESAVVYRARWWIGDYRRINYIRSGVRANIWYRLRREGIGQAWPARLLRPAPPLEDATAAAAVAAAAIDTATVFAPLSPGERRDLAARLRPHDYGRGETIIRQGEPGDSLFIVTGGQVEVRVATGGGEGVVGTLGPGSVFGEMSLLTGEPRTASVVALGDARLVRVGREDFRRIAGANPAVLEAVAGVVAGRRGHLRETIQDTEESAAARARRHADLLDRVRDFFRD